MAGVLSAAGHSFDAETDVLIIGSGACGLTAGLAASGEGADVLIVERDATASGSTALSSGFVPAAGTVFQQKMGIEDNPKLFAADIQSKAAGTAEATLVQLASQNCGIVLEWLASQHGLDWVVLDGFLYPGHSRHRMHAVPEKTGLALMSRLLAAGQNAGVSVATQAQAHTLFVDDDRISGIQISRPDGRHEKIACQKLILACNGYGGNSDLIAKYIPEMANALYFGHSGNQGDAIEWGAQLGAQTRHLTGYQGHGSVASPHGILITWALMMEGGIQVNLVGKRFSNEHRGYSEQSLAVLAQPGGLAWNIYDERLHQLGLGFEDYRSAVQLGAVKQAETLQQLCELTKLPDICLEQTLEKTFRCHAGDVEDSYGRDFTDKPALEPPWYAVRVTGALFHTQGGLMINENAQVQKEDGGMIANLYAAGGAACGVSGPSASGYLSGNGLLTALTFGALAGWHAGKR